MLIITRSSVFWHGLASARGSEPRLCTCKYAHLNYVHIHMHSRCLAQEMNPDLQQQGCDLLTARPRPATNIPTHGKAPTCYQQTARLRSAAGMGARGAPSNSTRRAFFKWATETGRRLRTPLEVKEALREYCSCRQVPEACVKEFRAAWASASVQIRDLPTFPSSSSSSGSNDVLQPDAFVCRASAFWGSHSPIVGRCNVLADGCIWRGSSCSGARIWISCGPHALEQVSTRGRGRASSCVAGLACRESSIMASSCEQPRSS